MAMASDAITQNFCVNVAERVHVREERFNLRTFSRSFFTLSALACSVYPFFSAPFPFPDSFFSNPFIIQTPTPIINGGVGRER